MDATAIATLITNVGFAAAAYIMLFNWMKDREKQTNETINRLSDVINNNTLAIQKLTDKTEEHYHADMTGGTVNDSK